MKTLFVSIALLGLAGAFSLITLTGDKHMITDKEDSPASGARPEIDTQKPGRIETATFALG